MDNATAKQVLVDMGVTTNWIFLMDGPKVDADPGGLCWMEGQFTAGQLEAISRWMNDPDGVMNSEVKDSHD